MGQLLAGFLALKAAELQNPRRRRYWRKHPEEVDLLTREVTAFRSLTEQEVANLESDTCLPSDDRMAEISRIASLDKQHLVNIFLGFAMDEE